MTMQPAITFNNSLVSCRIVIWRQVGGWLGLAPRYIARETRASRELPRNPCHFRSSRKSIILHLVFMHRQRQIEIQCSSLLAFHCELDAAWLTLHALVNDHKILALCNKHAEKSRRA